MNWTLEVVHLTTADLDVAKAFYADRLGFAVDHDTSVVEGTRFVQLTPPGSGCSIVLSQGMFGPDHGRNLDLQLVVNDVRAAREELAGRGVEIGEVQFYGPEGIRPAEPEDDLNNSGFAFFTDPDGNTWGVQQITARP